LMLLLLPLLVGARLSVTVASHGVTGTVASVASINQNADKGNNNF